MGVALAARSRFSPLGRREKPPAAANFTKKGDEFQKFPNKINKTKFFHPRPFSLFYPSPRPALGYT